MKYPVGLSSTLISESNDLAKRVRSIEIRARRLVENLLQGQYHSIFRGTGIEFDNQKQALKKGSDIIICTPGRLLAHLDFDYFDTSSVKHLILDEADRMLDMGFYDDIMKISNTLPKNRQTLLFSATMPPKIRELANKLLKLFLISFL